MEDLPESPPKNINPYKTLNLDPKASVAEVRSAYKKLALKHHPDKVPTSQKPTAHITFQQIALAYAILSSPSRRSRYDLTGSTSESLDADSDFDWISFFRTQFAETLSAEKIHSFSASYKDSENEKRDVLSAYQKHKGKWSGVYANVMLSNPLDDEERFRGYIDAAIEDGEVEPYDAYTKEPKARKEARLRKARKEAKEAEEAAKGNEKYQSIFGGDGKGGRKPGGSDAEQGLAELIQQKNKGRAESFLDGLEAKYASGTKGKGTKRNAAEEPDEQAFQATRAKMEKKAKANSSKPMNGKGVNGKTKGTPGRKKKAKVADEEEEEKEEEEEEEEMEEDEIDLEQSSDDAEDEGEEEEEEEEETKPAPKKKKPQKPKATAAKKATRTGSRRGKK